MICIMGPQCPIIKMVIDFYGPSLICDLIVINKLEDDLSLDRNYCRKRIYIVKIR